MLAPSRYNVDVGAQKLLKPISSALLIFGNKRVNFGILTEGSSGEDFDGRQREGSSWLQGGKPLGFLNSRAKLSLGKKRNI